MDDNLFSTATIKVLHSYITMTIKINYLKYLFILFLSISALSLQAQEERKVIQFSGVVVTEDANGEIQPLPYTNVSILGTSRGTVTEIDGFFSLVAQTNDTIVFSRVGYEPIRKGIPDTLDSSFYSWYQVMSKGNVLLPEAVIKPWPSKENYRIEFLALNVDNEMRKLAQANLAQNVLDELIYTLPKDGTEAYSYVAEEQFQAYRTSGQFKPQQIFNPAAWAEFIKAWKRGDYKRK